MKVREIAAAIEAFAPLGTQESWDNAGLCIGSPDAEVRAVLVGFDCTPALVREAVDRGADMIVTHHPLIFGGLRRIERLAEGKKEGEAIDFAFKELRYIL